MRGSGVKDCPAPIVSQSKSLRARDPLERAISLGIAELVGAPRAVLLIVLAAMTRIRAVSVYGSAWLAGAMPIVLLLSNLSKHLSLICT